MPAPSESESHFEIAGHRIGLNERYEFPLVTGETYSGAPIKVPVCVWRADKPGPSLLVTAAVHGDEINGTGVVRSLINEPRFDIRAGTLVLVPVVNIPGFERHVRYMPDRRDLNRAFPGSHDGSFASRYAHAFMNAIVERCQYCIDFHTASMRRTNFPNVRADMRFPEVGRIARAFGCEFLIENRGPVGTLRRSACRAGCNTIVVEAGEVFKMEPSVAEYGVRGVENVLTELGMIEGRVHRPPFQIVIRKTRWFRASLGGILHFHVAPGDLLQKGQPIATNTTILGQQQGVVESPVDGVVLGMTTMPAVSPGAPICHIGIPRGGTETIKRARREASGSSLHQRIRDDLATNVTVSEPLDSTDGENSRG